MIAPVKLQRLQVVIGKLVNVSPGNDTLSYAVSDIGLRCGVVQFAEQQRLKTGLLQSKRQAAAPGEQVNARERCRVPPRAHLPTPVKSWASD